MLGLPDHRIHALSPMYSPFPDLSARDHGWIDRTRLQGERGAKKTLERLGPMNCLAA